MNKMIFILTLFLTTAAGAETKREHKAHKHGAAKMSIAFEGIQGKIGLELASAGLFGFEYMPKTESDKKKQKEALDLLEKNISNMVVFAAESKCLISKEKIEVDYHEGGKHSDVDASFNVKCEKDPSGTVMTFNIQNYFPKLTDVDVEVLVGDVQKSIEAKASGVKLDLKK